MQIPQTLTLVFSLLFSFCLTAQTRLLLDKNLMVVDSGKPFEYYQEINTQKDGLTFIKLFNKDGIPIQQGAYSQSDQGVDLLEEGMFRYFNGSKKPWYQVEFKNGKRDGMLASWYPSGASKRIEYFKNDVSQGGECYAEDGKPIAFTPFWRAPRYKKGPEALEKFLQSQIKYPKSAYDIGQEGDVAVKLTVSTEGKVVNDQEVGSDYPLLNQEAVRVASLLDGWTAGLIDDVEKEYTVIVTVRFRLADYKIKFRRPPGSMGFDLIKDYIDTGKRFYINSERNLVAPTQPYVYQGEATSMPNGQMLITHYDREGAVAQKGVYTIYTSMMAVMAKSDSEVAKAPLSVADQNNGSFVVIGSDLADNPSAIAPRFPDGKADLFRFLQHTTNYPADAKEYNIQGTVWVQFVIEKDGSVTDVMLLEDIGGGCGREVVRVVKQMPNWIPGQVDGEPVRVRYTMPCRFKLE